MQLLKCNTINPIIKNEQAIYSLICIVHPAALKCKGLYTVVGASAARLLVERYG